MTATLWLALGAFLEGFERYNSIPQGWQWLSILTGFVFTEVIARFAAFYASDKTMVLWKARLAIWFGVPFGGICRLAWEMLYSRL